VHHVLKIAFPQNWIKLVLILPTVYVHIQRNICMVLFDFFFFLVSLINHENYLIISDTDNGLLSLMNDMKNTPPNWVGSDPCGSKWEGIKCDNSRVTSL
jgi:hypothetical protein